MGPKKKLTKKEKAKLEAEHAEAMRIELEKEKLRKFEEEKQKKMLERAEAERRHKQEIQDNKLRRIQLQESCEQFNIIKNEIKQIFNGMQRQKEWHRYMRCNGLPNAYDPSDLRKYMHMWNLSDQRKFSEERNWLLKTNERTILTQNQTILDLTKIALKKQQENLGDLYAKRIKEVLGILNEIEEAAIDTDNLSQSILNDLKGLKFEFRKLLSEHLDEYAYKILSNINRDMILDGPIIAKHLYESDVFKCQLWTIRDIPQPQLNPKEKARAEKRHTEIEFPALEINVALPPSIKCKNSAIRALWLNYDHFSDCCPSFNIPYNKKIIDISLAARKEWKKRKELLKSTLAEPIKQNTAAVPFDSMDNEEEAGVIDVDKLYSQYEEELNKAERLKIGPEGLNLKEFDINLRSHRIISGVFCIEYLEQPPQDTKLCTNTFLRTVNYPNNLKRNHFHHPYRAPDPVQPGVRRLPEEIEAEMKLMEKNLDKMVSIVIKLPDNVMWFEPPTVCRWETPDETKLAERLKKQKGKNQDYRQKRMKKTSTDHKSRLTTIEDFNLNNIPSGLDIHCLMEEFVIPRLPNGFIIKMKGIDITRKNSIMKYVNKDEIIDVVSRKPSIIIQSINIKDMMEETNSPRPLFPKIIIKRSLEVVEKIQRPYKLETIVDHLNENTHNTTHNIYMFSQLLKDLDELSELQSPYFEKQIDDISASLSLSNLGATAAAITTADNEDENDTELEYSSGMTFLKANNEYSWMLAGRKDESENLIASEQNNVDDDDDDDDDDDSCDDGDSLIDQQRNILAGGNENENRTIKNQNDLLSEIPQIGKWSTRDVHDIKFNEEKLAIQFKVGRLGTFGLAVNWNSNLPYQTWELKPDTKTPGSVIFSLTASVISIELSIFENGVQLNAFQGGTSTIIQDSVGGNIMDFGDLKKMFTTAGINLFPNVDAFCYAEGTCVKNTVMEEHLHSCMANLSLTHNFSWSRWNLLSGSRTTVLLMREIIEHRKIPNYLTLLVTPLKACLIECTEVSPNFNANPVSGMNFYADLHHLSLAHSQPSSLEKHMKMKPLLRENVIQVLKSTRPLSFC